MLFLEPDPKVPLSMLPHISSLLWITTTENVKRINIIRSQNRNTTKVNKTRCVDRLETRGMVLFERDIQFGEWGGGGLFSKKKISTILSIYSQLRIGINSLLSSPFP